MTQHLQGNGAIVQMPYRCLGRTGERVSLIGLGGYHVGIQKEEQESIRLIRTAIDNGINFLDNSWDYNEGVSEIRMGKALRDGYRKKVFLMTKIDGQDKKTAGDQLEECLRRLQTETIDLLHLATGVRRRLDAQGDRLERRRPVGLQALPRRGQRGGHDPVPDRAGHII